MLENREEWSPTAPHKTELPDWFLILTTTDWIEYRTEPLYNKASNVQSQSRKIYAQCYWKLLKNLKRPKKLPCPIQVLTYAIQESKQCYLSPVSGPESYLKLYERLRGRRLPFCFLLEQKEILNKRCLSKNKNQYRSNDGLYSLYRQKHRFHCNKINLIRFLFHISIFHISYFIFCYYFLFFVCFV